MTCLWPEEKTGAPNISETPWAHGIPKGSPRLLLGLFDEIFFNLPPPHFTVGKWSSCPVGERQLPFSVSCSVRRLKSGQPGWMSRGEMRELASLCQSGASLTAQWEGALTLREFSGQCRILSLEPGPCDVPITPEFLSPAKTSPLNFKYEYPGAAPYFQVDV